ncbi:MAG: hypothetical protein NTX76_04540 [Alphaproteobacteria bacterium]|nr:hypothetical protein [Alphaproteobacteria bacterium]
MTKNPKDTPKQARLVAALRKNLIKRKQQQQMRSEPKGDESPADSSLPSPRDLIAGPMDPVVKPREDLGAL